jgi:putative tryptophan/tyrosine transport system substrate-binding protein
MIRRRTILAAIASSAFAAPLVTFPQARVWRIGFVGLAPASGWSSQTDALRAGLRDLGYVEGSNLLLEFRWAKTVGETPHLAAELVALKVDLIIAPASTQVEPARRATRTIPIVFAQHADPVGTGHVVSLARPGGNVTGVSMLLTEVAAKGLELLKEALPQATRIGVLSNPTTPTHPLVVQAVRATATALGIELIITPVQEVGDFEVALSRLARENADGFLVPTSPLTNSQPAPLAQAALKNRLPGMFGHRANVAAGGLMSYGADFNYMYRRAAMYVDRILRGSSPAELPVEQASRYHLVINRVTAKAIGVTIPTSLLLRADELVG